MQYRTRGWAAAIRRWSRLIVLLMGVAACAWPHSLGAETRIDAPPVLGTVNASWDADRLVVTWSGAGCVWLVGGPGLDVLAPDGCGDGGAVRLGPGDANYAPQLHQAVEWRPWGDGAPVRVAVPPRVYRLWMPVGVGR